MPAISVRQPGPGFFPVYLPVDCKAVGGATGRAESCDVLAHSEHAAAGPLCLHANMFV